MSDPHAPLLALLEPELAQLRPGGAEVIDVHTHLGLDEDGMTLDPEGLLAMLDSAGAERAVTFPLHDPERDPAYRVPNDRVLQWAAASEGRLVPFCRLDPLQDPVREAERCLEAGARGIKLHPRAQAFALVGLCEPIFALAEQAGVPILIHAGRGLPEGFGQELVELGHMHPGASLIMAHVGVADQGTLADGLRDHPAAVFDSSWMNVLDTLALFARVPAERITFGSDPPYGRTFVGLYMILRVAACLGLDADVRRHLIGGAAANLVEGRPLMRATAPAAPEQLTLDARLARLHANLMIVFGLIFAGAPDRAVDMLWLSMMTCRDPRPGRAGPALERIAPLLDGARGVLIEQPDTPRLAAQPIVLAMAIAATEVPQTRPAP